MNADLPGGSNTFLFTDIEGSVQLWERHPEAMKIVLARHDSLFRQAVETHGGYVVKSTGDGGFAVFTAAANALAAVIMFQLALTRETWVDQLQGNLHVRAGLHTGEAELREDDYFGTTPNRAARIMSIGHGGQVLLSAATAGLVIDSLSPEVSLYDLGEHLLRGLTRPERIYQLVFEGLPKKFPPLRTVSARVVSLPQQPTSFIDRQEEVDEILRLMSAPGARLLSLVGPGGMGKTRLGIQVAAILAEREPDRFTDGLFFVPLAPLNSEELMITAIAGTLGFQLSLGKPDPQRQLLDYLRRRELLLVLDNMEQLLDNGGAAITAEILATAPRVHILVTSRTRLGIQGEHIFLVPDMRLPDPDAVRSWTDLQAETEHYTGLRLFMQAAGRIRPDFRLTRDNIAAVVRIGRQVQGMPLGIELAAGWLELLSPSEIASEIDRSVDMLATGFHGVPDRQRSMRAVFDTTWQLLSERERVLLPPLSIFRAPFTREAAEAVAGAGLHDLLSLANKSWLQRIKGADGASRFQMHELLRQFAEEKLNAEQGLTAETQRRLVNFTAGLLERYQPLLIGAEQLAARDSLTADFENIAVAWYLSIEQGDYASLVGKMVLPLYLYGQLRPDLVTIDQLLEDAIATRRKSADEPENDTPLAVLRIARVYRYLDVNRWADLALEDITAAWAFADQLANPVQVLGFWYTRLCILVTLIDEFAAGKRRLYEWVSGLQAGDLSWLASEARLMLGGLILLMSNTSLAELAEADAMLHKAAAGFQRLGSAYNLSQVYKQLAIMNIRKRAYGQAYDRLVQAQALLAQLGTSAVGWLLDVKTDLLLRQGRIDEMFTVLEEQAQIGRDKGDLQLESYAYSWESLYALRYSTPDHALRLRHAVIELERAHSGSGTTNWHDFELGEIARVSGDMAMARGYYESSAALFEKHGNGFGLAFCDHGYGDLALAEGDPGAALAFYQRSLERLSEVHWWAEARSLAGLARAFIALGQDYEAIDPLLRALRITDHHNELSLATLPLFALAELALARGQTEDAAVLTGVLSATPLTWNETRMQMAVIMSQISAVLGEAAAPAFARGQAIDLAELITGLTAIPYRDPDGWLYAAGQLIDGLQGKQKP